MTDEELIRGCLKHDRAAQRTVYEIYFRRMMQVCLRYAKNQEHAKEILLDGFKTLFNTFSRFSDELLKRKKTGESLSLDEWIKKEMVEAAIRHMHANRKEHFVSSTVNVRDAEKFASAKMTEEQIMKSANSQAILTALRQLSPSLRTIYNLHEVDGYSRDAISKLLDVSEYSVTDSLSKAKFSLRKNLEHAVPHKS